MVTTVVAQSIKVHGSEGIDVGYKLIFSNAFSDGQIRSEEGFSKYIVLSDLKCENFLSKDYDKQKKIVEKYIKKDLCGSSCSIV